MSGPTVAEELYVPTFDDMLAAQKRIEPYVNRTPVMTSSFLNALTGAELFFKCENFQKAGAFKVRGASNAVFGLSEEKARAASPRTSSGNHALSLSYAAGRRGIPCHVVMPRTAPQAKKDAVRGYGGQITECEPSTSSREAVFAEVEARTGADFVHPYNDPRVIAGQATCSRELMEQVEGLEAVIAPIGGGGHGVGHLPHAVAHGAGRGDLRGRAGAGRRRLPQLQGGPHHRGRRAEHGRGRLESAAQGPHVAFRPQPRLGHLHRERTGDR
jgi:threonine dehydratase